MRDTTVADVPEVSRVASSLSHHAHPPLHFMAGNTVNPNDSVSHSSILNSTRELKEPFYGELISGATVLPGN